MASNDFAIPVNVVSKVFIEVVEATPGENASIISSDNQVQLSDAPTTLADLVKTLDVTAVDPQNKGTYNTVYYCPASSTGMEPSGANDESIVKWLKVEVVEKIDCLK